ncbi:hypothetical protein IWQ56_004781, partial [Coemansia nantahalensis]
PYTPLSASVHPPPPLLTTPPYSRPPIARRPAAAGASLAQPPPPLLLLGPDAEQPAGAGSGSPDDGAAQSTCSGGEDGDRYRDFAARATAVIRQTAATVRGEHRARHAALDSDSQYAAGLLRDLRAERDAAQVEADRYQAVVDECQAADAREAALQQRVACTVSLQLAARATAAAMGAGRDGRPCSSDADAAALSAEYRELRRRASVYEHGSRRLAAEYAQLAATVTPWARAPARAPARALGRADDPMAVLDELLGSLRHPRQSPLLPDDADAADVHAATAALAADEERVRKLERVVAAACGDVPLDRVRTAVGPVLSVLNTGSTL